MISIVAFALAIMMGVAGLTHLYFALYVRPLLGGFFFWDLAWMLIYIIVVPVLVLAGQTWRRETEITEWRHRRESRF